MTGSAIWSALSDARSAFVGVGRLLAFRKDWRAGFDVSAEGVARSFSGVVLGLPAFAFTLLAANHFMAQNPVFTVEAGFGLLDAALIWLRFWLVFPLVAAATCLVLGLGARFASWLVVHNWTVFVLLHVQALIWALYPAGLADAEALGLALGFYQILRLFVHWRVAQGALGLPPALAAAVAGVPLAVDWLLIEVF